MTRKVLVLGHTGLVGSALVRLLKTDRACDLLCPTRQDLDLTRQADTDDYFARNRPDEVYLAAARVGGIKANIRFAADFIRENLQIQTNVIDAACRFGVRKLLFLGSSCIYPKDAPTPLRPEYLLSGDFEPTNRAYAVAKVAGIEMCRAYRDQKGFNAIVVMPCNRYGPAPSHEVDNAHVIPALLHRFHAAKVAGSSELEVWGSGNVRREFLHSDDLADAAVMLMAQYDGPAIVNVGTGEDLSIAELAEMIASVVGFKGRVVFDPSAPEGVRRKLLDVSVVRSLGWQPKVELRSGLVSTLSAMLR